MYTETNLYEVNVVAPTWNRTRAARFIVSVALSLRYEGRFEILSETIFVKLYTVGLRKVERVQIENFVFFNFHKKNFFGKLCEPPHYFQLQESCTQLPITYVILQLLNIVTVILYEQ